MERRSKHGQSKSPGRPKSREPQALDELQRIREPLFRELEKHLRNLDQDRDPAPHLCCKRKLNQMRISPLEARDILRAFRKDPELRRQLPAVLSRIRQEVGRLKDTTDRQNFDCPLLEGNDCLVHSVAKPIGCLAWNPGSSFSKAAWRAFQERDALNDRLHGPQWRLQAIPLWLHRVLQRAQARKPRSGVSGVSGVSPRNSPKSPSARKPDAGKPKLKG